MEDYSTCEISDALIKLGIAWGGLLSDIHCISPSGGTRVQGPAYTVKMVHFDDSSAPKPPVHFVDGAKEGHIIVIDSPPVRSAVWGGLMSYGARARGVIGVIISGRCRDVLEHEEAGMVVFAKGQSTLGQKPFTRPSELDVTLNIDGVTVQPGDWIVADQDGVVVIPIGMMESVKECCEKGRRVDELCKNAILKGKGVEESFNKYR